MTYDDIHTALKAKGYTWKIAAAAIECSYNHLLNVASGRIESSRVAKGIAALIGKPVLEVFPDKPHYADDQKKISETKLEEARLTLQNAGLAVAS